ncbi:hypothetical protein WDW89_00805 [Deltaproteobacteria bacterium TL4]
MMRKSSNDASSPLSYSLHPQVKYNPEKKTLSPVNQRIIFMSYLPDHSNYILLLKGTHTVTETSEPAIYCNTGSTTYIQETWSHIPNLASYSELIEDYDVSEVEEQQMQAAKNYGW